MNKNARTTDPDTSKNAYLLHTPRKDSQAAKLLAMYKRKPTGLTADEAAERAGLLNVGYWKRVSDLHRDGFIQDTDITRPGKSGAKQTVRTITPLGEDAVRKINATH